MQRKDFQAMGCDMSAIADSDTVEAASALAQAPLWFEAWEQALSRFRADSELSMLNRFAGYWFAPGETLWDVLQHALRAAHLTQGLASPTLLAQLESAGYDRSFDTLTEQRGARAASAPAAVHDWRQIEFDAAAHALRIPAGMRLDLGGIAKGWAAEQAARLLEEHGAIMVNAGGDIAARGTRGNGEPWPVGVTDPRPGNAQDTVARLDVLMVTNCGVATSGTDFRRWQHDGQPRHHIIDPRSGLPADTDVLAATVIAPTTIDAEAAAKAALILGSTDGLAWIEARPHFAALLVCNSGAIVRSSRYPSFTWNAYWQRTHHDHRTTVFA